MSEGTLQAIRDRLHEKFPGDRIVDNYLDGKRAHSFRIERGGRLVHQLLVARELLDGRRSTAVSTIFERFEIVRVLEQAGVAAVSVSSGGATIESNPGTGAPPPAPPAARGEPVDTPPAPVAAPPAPVAAPPAPVAAPAFIEIPPVPPPAPTPTAVPPATAVAPPAATSDPFAAALGLIRELRQGIQGVDNNLRQSVHDIDADLAEAEASVVDAEARFRKATAQLAQLLASMDTVVARARAGLDRVLRRSH